APLLRLSKRQIVERGLELGIDFALTSSCYDPDAAGAACGVCDACTLRLRGFAEAGVEDPANYARR
ncbi:MAG TPA: 7-cyano-7-deazaguanine synthase, partial [Gemmatimonadales bacterium]|nr:7-cyano-7-deazaguanine synthase [Gemmatimonadales bacterium]